MRVFELKDSQTGVFIALYVYHRPNRVLYSVGFSRIRINRSIPGAGLVEDTLLGLTSIKRK